MKNNKGFSLVELIVVIAIMAILAAVAVIGVSVYIPKAQQASDRQTISDTIDAFTLYYYSNPDGVTSGYVVLGPNGVVLDESGNPRADAFGAAAMEATFGADWATAIKLQYADWQGVTSTATYKDTSYIGNEGELLGTVDKLTTALGNAISNDESLSNALMGSGFGEFLEGYPSVETENGKALGNAAVLYVAQNTKEKGDEINAGFTNGLGVELDDDPTNDGTEIMFNLFNALSDENVGNAAALAAIFAYAEGYAQATGQADAFHANADFTGVTTTDQALNVLGATFNSMPREGFEEYAFGSNGEVSQGTKDLQGYIDMMGTVDQNKDIVSGNLNSDDCFTDGKIESLLSGHAAMSNVGISTENGEVAIVLFVDKDGVPRTHVAPLNWNE